MYLQSKVKRAKDLVVGDIISDGEYLYSIISIENTFINTHIFARPVALKTVGGVTRVGAIFREMKWKKIYTYKEKKENESNLHD